METPAYLLALRARYPLHPVFNHIKPTEAVLIEHPHVAETDPTRIAYTRNPKDGEDFLINGHKRQTLTSVTKYIRRHYPDLKDHEIFSLSQQSDEFKFLTDIKEIIHAVETGPSSCMKSRSSVCQHEWKMAGQTSVMKAWLKDQSNDEPNWDLHPYSVYNYPGWSLAIHKGPSPVDGTYQIIGRALVYKKVFVRSFLQNADPTGYSFADTALESWLQEQGIEKQSAWDDGTPLRHIETNDGPLLPYIDGDNCHVEVCGDRLRIREDECESYYKADNTDGTGDVVEEDQPEAIADCTDCGDTIYDGEDYSRVRDDYDTYICSSCLNNYTWVRAYSDRHVTRWYVPDEDVIEVDGDNWDRENLSDDIIQLKDGDCTDVSNAVEIDGEWYRYDDSRICEIEGEYHLKENCWQDVDGNYHTTDEEFATVDNCRYSVDDDRIVKTAEGFFCLVDEAWEDVDGGYHAADTPYFEVDNKLFTAAQLEELHKDQLLLEFV
jgi:hypothetical protein